ncbi:hypothetical protein [uncultured Planococcus sp.]|uniref:hypothetical protein n=2 Tax=Planococcus TaxID=1372 RepID=UPI00263688F0|nr:hypothetical protein [uncultured Planococcus sp.]
MKNWLIILITLAVLILGNWVAAAILQMAFLDIAIPFAGLALVLIYFFKSKGGMASRQLDMSIQGQTGIRMEREAHSAGRSYIFIGSVLYLLIVIGLTFYIYREYF